MENTWKALITAALTALTVYLQKMMIPVLVMILVMVLDYASGMVNAALKGEINSATGFRGIVKKVGYLVLVIVGMVMDYLIQMGLARVGWEVGNTYIVAMLVTVWLIINECISIIENCGEIGLPVPEFMQKILLKLKADTEAKTNTDEVKELNE